jgi:hypothetical protein
MVASRSALAALYGRPRLASYRPCGRGRPQTLSSFSWRGSRTAPRPMPCAQLARRAKPTAGRRARRPQRIGYQADLDFAPPSEAWRYHTTRRRFLRNWQSALVRRVDVDRSPSDMSTAGCAVRGYELGFQGVETARLDSNLDSSHASQRDGRAGVSESDTAVRSHDETPQTGHWRRSAGRSGLAVASERCALAFIRTRYSDVVG